MKYNAYINIIFSELPQFSFILINKLIKNILAVSKLINIDDKKICKLMLLDFLFQNSKEFILKINYNFR